MRRATGIGITARRLIPGPLDHLVLFGSSLLVPKQRAVTSTGAYRMGQGSEATSYKQQASSVKLDK